MTLEFRDIRAGLGVDGKGAFIGLGWNNTIEASLFRGAVNVRLADPECEQQEQ